jgi:hypothetical protein
VGGGREGERETFDNKERPVIVAGVTKCRVEPLFSLV